MAFEFDNAVVRDIKDQMAAESSVYKSALWNAGVINSDPDLANKVGANDGRLFTTHFYRELADPTDVEAGAGPVYPDDSDTAIATVPLDNAEYQVVKNGPIVSFDQKSVVKRFNFLADPVGVVVGMLNEYWAKYYDKYAVNTFIGIIQDNETNDASDCLLDIGDAAAVPGATNTMQPSTVILAEALKGDAANFSVIVMHSKVYNNLRIQNLIDTIPSSDGKVNFQVYQNKFVIVSDNVEVNTAGANNIYTSYLMGSDVMRFGSNLGSDIIGFETHRSPTVGKGSGKDQIISRTQFALHPVGYSWLDASVTGSVAQTSGANLYPNWTDLKNVLNWNRVAASHKHIPWVAIRTNG